MISTRLTIAAFALLIAGIAHAGPYDIPGFVTIEKEGRLWVFKTDSKEHASFLKGEEPAKQFSDIGSGPDGMTVKAADQATLREYLAAAKK
jgi:hypothetical protein